MKTDGMWEKRISCMSENCAVKREIYSEITVLHVIGTIMILLCHFFQEAKVYILGEVFISGVPLFFIVSGYLAGLKKCISFSWVLKRAKRILKPYYLWILPIMMIYICINNNAVSLKQFMFLITNIQGLNYIYWKAECYEAVAGFGHLWFVTVIMVCVVLTPFVSKLIDRITLSKKRILGIILIITLVLQPLGVAMGFQFSYIITYFIGFVLAKFPMEFSKVRHAVITIFLIMITIIRVVARNFIDGSNLYDRYIALVSATMLALWIFYTVFFVRYLWPNVFDKKTKWKIVQFFSGISYEIYLTHYLFLRGLWPFGDYIKNSTLSNILVLFATVATAKILSVVTGTINTKIEFIKRRKQIEKNSSCRSGF